MVEGFQNTTHVLNGSEEIRKRDADGMLAILGRLDEQMEEALEIGLKTQVLEPDVEIRNVLVCGLGGSAIGGELLRVYLKSDLKVPFLINRNYSIPCFADESTLALICSYSGNTEEVISAFEQAQAAGCQIVCSTSGGHLRRLAETHGHACFQMPEGYPPRAALGYSMIPMLSVLSRVGLISDRSDEVRSLINWVGRRLKHYGPRLSVAQNQAKRLALQLHGKIPVIYGSQDALDMVAVRWRGQFAENGKQLTYSSALPEMNHNEIVGWKYPDDALRYLAPVFLRDREDHPRIQTRTEMTREWVEEKAGVSFECWSEGESWLERLWSLIILGDYTSIYLAFLNQENPTPVEVIDYFKTRLKEQ